MTGFTKYEWLNKIIEVVLVVIFGITTVVVGIALWGFSVVIFLLPFAVAIAVFIWAFRAIGLL